ncbi:hypothetical protein LshimejAT787_1900330 [Lyophyllum shimeji]|uniref:Uncharacterized protein n=1 Tax=Lyophyllum shimeji TaxID=47721 RepID=A0A9P3PXQ0_LYOSH|nr:hypothetical protein LshimejAT787_1900330 [Lyophyllum shimeji]
MKRRLDSATVGGSDLYRETSHWVRRHQYYCATAVTPPRRDRERHGEDHDSGQCTATSKMSSPGNVLHMTPSAFLYWFLTPLEPSHPPRGHITNYGRCYKTTLRAV